ncbi:ankyrin [Coprinopsis marcescibilis]|uniref:Ankyrin n=1 Tax=Coprinopsis marcescibilis TaxID=230819 RepID=A0A5C3KAV2_COPMA|nr:ankyrin [Coprinopsis marcescibilis]
MEGGILNNAQGIHIEGAPTFNNVQSYNTYNTTIQPGVSEKDAELFEKIVEWISDINYHAIQADNYGKRAEGTGEWAFDDPNISKWLEGVLGILWGVGMPGAGKTILSSFIIDHLLKMAKANKRICVAFAFSRYTDQFTGEKVLGGLLRQVVQDHPFTLTFVKPMYDHHRPRKTRPSQKELLEVLRAIFNSDMFDERYCTLDGLDEALANTQVDVLDALSNLPVNFLIMSRPLPLLKELVPEAIFIDIMVHDADIEQLIEEKLRRMKTLRNLLEKDGWKEKVLKTVLDKSSGMFLLASLQLHMLGECMHIKDLRSALDSLPMGVNSMYEATMERIEGRPGSNLALRALTWLVYAQQSLTINDLRHALAVDTATFIYDSDLLVDPETLLSVCCGLTTFEPETKLVRLVHYTARDFLECYLSKRGADAQATLACTCVARLRACGFENYDGDIDDYHLVFRNHPFLEYAHRNWATHAQGPESLPPFVEEFIQGCQCFPWHDTVFGFDDLSSIQLAAACNFHSLLARWLGLNSPSTNKPPSSSPSLDINSRSLLGRTALALAAANGHIETVQLLIGVEGIDIESSDTDQLTPLTEASYGGHVQVVDMLLEVIDADHVNAGRRTALMQAAIQNHTEVMKSLLRVQAINVNDREPENSDGDGDSALTLAAFSGCIDAVRLLLGVDGIEINASHWGDGTALAQASNEGHKDIVEILLQKPDIDINASQCREGTALMRAAYWGHEDIVKLLLQREEIQVNTARPDGETALSLALEQQHKSIAELLRSHGAH